MIKQFLYIILSLSATLICSDRAISSQVQTEPFVYKAPEIPSTITSESDRTDYFAAHYWDNFDTADKTISNSDTIIEQAFRNFILQTMTAAPDSTYSGYEQLLNNSRNSPQVTEQLLKLAEKYLYDRKSPYRDDVTFSKFIHYSNLKCLDEYQQFYWNRLAIISSLNNPGNPTNNFSFYDSENIKRDLYDIDGKFILLIFVDPDCEDCHNLKALINSADIPIECKTITIYCGDDIQLWRKSIEDSNPLWINGYDKDFQIIDSDLYDIRTYPTIYLLDKDKNVILKDTQFNEVLKYFMKL